MLFFSKYVLMTNDNSLSLFAFHQIHQILSVSVLEHRLGQFLQLLLANPSLVVGDLFQTSHLQSLALLNHLDEGAGFRKTVVGTGIKPGKTALQGSYLQRSSLPDSAGSRW